MATLLVRKLEPELVERLRQRARAHGRSVEAEHRESPRAALAPMLSGKDLFELLRQGEPFPAEADPDSWRFDDRGEPADRDPQHRWFALFDAPLIDPWEAP